jgi:DNA (cytosine-5)-methyltransferase 1
MARAAKVFRPSHIIIENVQGLPHDRSGVLERTLDVLGEEGYHFSHGLVDIARLGVPQRRRRHIVLASRVGPVRDLHDIVLDAECNERDVAWAIKDLSDSTNGSIVNTPSRPSKDNHARMDYLFDNGLFELPNEQRPPCHRDKKQTYTSVYGRMRWDRPSQTITSGFFSMCMGRYVHPERRRTITAHEAARLQFFPDYFKFESAKSRTALARIIGNAVPMKLSYVLARELLVER